MGSNGRVALVVTVALVSLAGCSGLTGGGGGGITIADERADDGATHFYVASSDGLPADTEITIEATLEYANEASENNTVSTTLNESTGADERVYLGARSGGVATVGERPEEAPLNVSRFSESTTITITVTVDTGDRTATETFTYTGTGTGTSGAG